MLNFPSFFINKKIILFVFLFVILISPSFASALMDPSGNISNTQYTAMDPATPKAPSVSSADACKSITAPLDSIIYGFGSMFVWVPEQTAKLTASMASATMELSKYPITRDTGDKTGIAAKAFRAGWVSTRDLANMLIVLGFVIVGIATSLRISEYAAKKALFPLIMVALLINFSGLFCGLIIDASNLTMKGLVDANGSASSSIGTGLLAGITKNANETNCDLVRANKIGEFIVQITTWVFLYIAITIAFLFLALALIGRYVLLGLLYVLSPIAFACYAFPMPKAKAIFTKWWENFLSWAFVGVGICFFLNIAGAVNSSFTVSGFDGGTVMSVFLMLGIIVAGIIISLKSSPAIGGVVMGIAKGAGAMMLGAAGAAALGGAKMADKATGGIASTAAQKLNSGYGRALERVGLRATGTTAGANEKRVNDTAATMSKAYSSGTASEKARIQRLAMNGTGERAAAAYKTISAAGDLQKTFTDKHGNFDTASAAKRLSYSEANGAIGLKKEALKENYNLAAAMNPDRVTAVKNAHPGMSQEEAERTINREQLATNIQGGMSTSAIGNIDHRDLKGAAGFHFIKDNMSPSFMNKMKISATPDLRATVQAHSGDFKIAELVAHTEGDTAEATKMKHLKNSIDRL